MGIEISFLRSYWYIVLIIVIFGIILPALLNKFSPRIKGLIGEKSVASLLTKSDKGFIKITSKGEVDSKERQKIIYS
jgi:hypothetical protein